MKRIAVLLALALCAIPSFQPASALQGESTGTLPNRTIERRTGALSAWQTVKLDSDSGATAVIASTHDAEEALPPAGPQELSSTWRWHHTTMTLKTERWSGESDDHWRTRHADSLTAMMTRFPADDT